jgi:hypothetical protein
VNTSTAALHLRYVDPTSFAAAEENVRTDAEDAVLIATSNAELVTMLAELQAEESEHMAPFWAAMEKFNAELVVTLREVEASPERQEFHATLAEINEEWRRDILPTLAELLATQPDQLG